MCKITTIFLTPHSKEPCSVFKTFVSKLCKILELFWENLGISETLERISLSVAILGYVSFSVLQFRGHRVNFCQEQCFSKNLFVRHEDARGL